MESSLRLLLVTTWAVALASGHPTSNAFSYYEKLNYDPSALLNQHTRVTREASMGGRGQNATVGGVRLHLQAFNRSFVSDLSRGRGVFGPSIKFLVDGKESTEYDPRTFYSGTLIGEPGRSRVAGHIIGGVFDGTITTQQGTFHVERAHKFFPGARNFHSVIYHEKDVLDTGSASSCGVKGQLLEELRKKAAHAVPLNEDKVLYGKDRHSRLKRATINNNRFCPIRVAADHLYFDNVGRGNVVNTMSDIVSLIDSVQEIYSDTDFDGNGSPDSIQPVIVSLEIFRQSDPGYRFSASSIGVNDFLDLWSQYDQSQFCLALLLTYRDFANGVLGLAWVAQPPGGNRGGICEGRTRLSSGDRYLNTAIVTFLNFGQMQPRSVSIITIAHEFGHNFGSPHDDSSCSGGSRGNYIMFPQATDGTLPNNDRFSSCSIDSIRPVLETKSDCFTATEAFCGNGIVEGEDEQCDCGSNCDMDTCCHGNNCSLTVGSVCSLSEPCCEVTSTDASVCQFRSSDTICLPESECGLASNCTGQESSCPTPMSRDNTILCNNGQNICVDGVCSGSVCVRMDHDDCQCSTGSDGDNSKLCHVCCRPRGGGECTSSFTLFGNDMGQFREGGRSCNNFQGYCSSGTPPVCVVVDNDQTLDDLLDIFNLNTLNIIAAWLQTYWYVPVIIFIVIAALIILLQVTYRKRKPLQKGINRMRNSTLRRQRGGASGAPAQSSGAARNRERQDRPRNREISRSEAEQRLKKFFPTADRETMVSVMRIARSESKAVKRMLELGYPLKKVPLPRS